METYINCFTFQIVIWKVILSLLIVIINFSSLMLGPLSHLLSPRAGHNLKITKYMESVVNNLSPLPLSASSSPVLPGCYPLNATSFSLRIPSKWPHPPPQNRPLSDQEPDVSWIPPNQLYQEFIRISFLNILLGDRAANLTNSKQVLSCLHFTTNF